MSDTQVLLVSMHNIQHIKRLDIEIDLSRPVMCLVGRNGSGKTTLVRALRNLRDSTTFHSTAGPGVLGKESRIKYNFAGNDYLYTYDETLNALDSKKVFQPSRKLSVELPIPYGERFKEFAKLAELDEEIRRHIVLQEVFPADELLSFYETIYQLDDHAAHRFKALKRIRVRSKDYYYIALPEGRYIREDYFSSGEYFALSLFRLAQQKNTLIVVDEFDISLDAAAQVSLLAYLRPLLAENNSCLLFTTHSMAMMQTLEEDELYFLEEGSSRQYPVIQQRSFGYVKTALFGFRGLDRVILVEDVMAARFLKWMLKDTEISVLYKIIPVGGHNHVFDLLNRALEHNYFELGESGILCCLDGDQRSNADYIERSCVDFFPFQDVEEEFKSLYERGMFSFVVSGYQQGMKGKKLIRNLLREQGREKETGLYHTIFTAIVDFYCHEFLEFKNRIDRFLNLNGRP